MSQDRCAFPDCGGGHDKWDDMEVTNVRTERQRKQRQGMQVTNTGIRKLPELAARPKGKRK